MEKKVKGKGKRKRKGEERGPNIHGRRAKVKDQKGEPPAVSSSSSREAERSKKSP
jgi:hypothetical protein